MGLKKKNGIRLIKRILFLMLQKALFFKTRNYETGLSSVDFPQFPFLYMLKCSLNIEII